MTKLEQLFESVKEKNLTKTDLESYRDDLTNLFASMQLEMAELEKLEAVYFLQMKQSTPSDKELTDVSIKRMWRGSLQGQRLIELNRYQKATEKVLSSLKSRIFAIY